MTQLSKEEITELLKETFPAIEARVLQQILNGYLHRGDLWYAVFYNGIRLNWMGEQKFIALVAKVKEWERIREECEKPVPYGC